MSLKGILPSEVSYGGQVPPLRSEWQKRLFEYKTIITYLMRRIAIILISLLGLIVLDVFSKLYVAGDNNLGMGILWERPCVNFWLETCIFPYFPILWEYFWLRLSFNSGIAFSLPITWIPLQVLTIILIIWLIWYYFHEEYPKKSRLLDIWYTLILAWALSHGYERIFFGYVVDFIAVKYFAILNFADIFISIWAFLIILFYVLTRKHR